MCRSVRQISEHELEVWLKTQYKLLEDVQSGKVLIDYVGYSTPNVHDTAWGQLLLCATCLLNILVMVT